MSADGAAFDAYMLHRISRAATAGREKGMSGLLGPLGACFPARGEQRHSQKKCCRSIYLIRSLLLIAMN